MLVTSSNPAGLCSLMADMYDVHTNRSAVVRKPLRRLSRITRVREDEIAVYKVMRCLRFKYRNVLFRSNITRGYKTDTDSRTVN